MCLCMNLLQEAVDDILTEIYEYPLWQQLVILLYVGAFFDSLTYKKNSIVGVAY